jgi:predicted AAA+ superfamily ATPase
MLHEYLEQFPAVSVVGARQVGKTTFLANELDGWTHVDLEDAAMAELVRRDPALFLRDHPDRVWFDEVHRVPGLFPALRVTVDRDRRPGRFVLSGSASGALTRDVSESLAGRAGILQLHPFTVAETAGRDPSPFLGRLLECTEPSDALHSLVEGRDPVNDRVLRSSWFYGGFPEPALLDAPVRWRRWFDSYVRSVSERDLVFRHSELEPAALHRLLRMLAARQGQVVNFAQLGRDFGVPAKKLGTLLDFLQGTFLWLKIEPFFVNIGKRLTQTPKGWIADAGLLHALLDLRGPDDLEVHPILGASWEGWILQELLAQSSLLDTSPRFLFYRTHAGAEVDILLEVRSRLIPIEIKHTSRIDPYDLRGLSSFLETLEARAPFGLVLCRTDQPVRLTEKIVALPAARIV